jgi:hypothetical protein
MTQLEFFTALANGAKWGVPASISRSGSANGGLPIDAYSIFKSKADAELYASQNKTAVEAAGMVNNAYIGQIVTVWAEDNSVEVYYINSDKTLKPVGIIPTGDSKTIEVTTSGAISLLGAASASNGTLPMIDSETGKLVWKTLQEIGAGDGNDNTTYTFELNDTATGFIVTPLFNGQPIYEGEGEEKVQVKTEIALDVYTKDEVDTAIQTLAEKIGVAAEGQTGTLYELIAAEVLRAATAESELSKRIGVEHKAAEGEEGSEDYKPEVPASGVYAYVDGVVRALVEGVDPKNIDSLNDLIEWVEAHPAIVDELDGRLDKVEATLTGFGGFDPRTVKEYVDETFVTRDEFNSLADDLSKHEKAAAETYATKAELTAHAEAAEAAYAKKATTLAGYGITDAYTKDEIDTKIGTPGVPEIKDEEGNKTADAIPGTGIYQHVYSKSEITDLIAEITGGESAADVKAELKEYKTTNDTRVKSIEDTIGSKAEGQTGTLYELIASVSTRAEKGITDAATADAKAVANAEAIVAANNAHNALAAIVNGTDNENSHAAQLAALAAKDLLIDGQIAALQGIDTTLQGTVSQHGEKLIALESKDGDLAGLIAANTAEIAKKALATDVEEINTKIGSAGDGAEANTVYGAIAKAQAAATYDDTAVKKLISDEVARADAEEKRIAGLLASEESRATGEEARIEGLVTAEASRADTEEKRIAGLVGENAAAIAELDATLKAALENDGQGLDSIKELVVWIE